MAPADSPTLRFTAGIPYTTRPEGTLRLDVLTPETPATTKRPVVVYLHGGGWHEGDRGAAMHPWLSPLLAARGFATVSPTYRLSGTATWPAQLDDARDALVWVRTHATDFGGDPDRIGVWGFSAGAHLAALLALTEGDLVSAAALAACPADLRGVRAGADDEVAWLLGGTPTPERLDEISPVCRVGASVPPLLIAHGSDDEIVPIAQAEALRDVARAAGGVVEWHEIVGARHSWADAPTAGLDEEAPSFGTLAADFFEWHLVFPA